MKQPFHCPPAGSAGLGLTCSQSLAQGSWGEGEEVVVGVLDWAGGYSISHAIVHSHRWVSLSTPVRQTAHVMICGVHYESYRTWTHQHIKASESFFCVFYPSKLFLCLF